MYSKILGSKVQTYCDQLLLLPRKQQNHEPLAFISHFPPFYPAWVGIKHFFQKKKNKGTVAPYSIHVYMDLEELSKNQKKSHCLYACPFFCFPSHSIFQFHIKHTIYSANVTWVSTLWIYQVSLEAFFPPVSRVTSKEERTELSGGREWKNKTYI